MPYLTSKLTPSQEKPNQTLDRYSALCNNNVTKAPDLGVNTRVRSNCPRLQRVRIFEAPLVSVQTPSFLLVGHRGTLKADLSLLTDPVDRVLIRLCA